MNFKPVNLCYHEFTKESPEKVQKGKSTEFDLRKELQIKLDLRPFRVVSVYIFLLYVSFYLFLMPSLLNPPI